MGHFTVSKGLGGAAQGVINTALLTQLLQCPAVRMELAPRAQGKGHFGAEFLIQPLQIVTGLKRSLIPCFQSPWVLQKNKKPP